MIIDNIGILKELIAVNENGIPERLIEDKTVSFLMELLHPVTFSPKEDIYYYENGVYQSGGEVIIRQILNKGLMPFRDIYNCPIISIKQSNEIVEKIRYTCMDSRDNFDKDLNIINMKNGLYNWTNGEFREHTPDYKSLIQIPVVYDPSATCETTLEILKEITPKEYYELALEYMAYLFYRKYDIQISLILYGPGGTGKSVFLDILKGLVGEKNCTAYSLHNLTTKQFSIHNLYDKLLNECGELDNTVVDKSGIFKMATSRTDILTGERKYLDPIYFVNFAKFVFACNELCPITDKSSGFWRRLVILQFLRKYTVEEYDYDKLAKIKEEKEVSGLFNEVIKRLPKIIKKMEFTNQPKWEDTLALYIALSNPLQLFARDGLFEDPANSGGVFKDYVYMQYIKLCEKYRQVPLHMNDFNKEIQKLCPFLKTGQKYDHTRQKKRASWNNCSLTNFFTW